MKMNDKRKYVMEFNTHDKNMTGYLAGTCMYMFIVHTCIHAQWNLYNVVTLEPKLYDCNIRGGCIIEVVHYPLCTLGP